MLALVAPLAGAWIEISLEDAKEKVEKVAPLAGAWIEISLEDAKEKVEKVAPLAGAWIEIGSGCNSGPVHKSRSPRGSVD